MNPTLLFVGDQLWQGGQLAAPQMVLGGPSVAPWMVQGTVCGFCKWFGGPLIGGGEHQ